MILPVGISNPYLTARLYNNNNIIISHMVEHMLVCLVNRCIYVLLFSSVPFISLHNKLHHTHELSVIDSLKLIIIII